MFHGIPSRSDLRHALRGSVGNAECLDDIGQRNATPFRGSHLREADKIHGFRE
jgi:hypothetical protein